MKKYYYKYIVGLMLGILTSSVIVAYATTYISNEVRYNNTNSTLTSINVQDAIDELASSFTPYITCPSDYICVPLKSTLSLGDYISYTPSKTSYTTITSQTGYTSTQTINPSELNLWRVLSINNNGTVDIISENTSSTAIYFRGLVGYQNLVGYLNVLASQYENSAYTNGSRCFGYSNQTQNITNTTYFTNPAPWTCNTGNTCSPDPDDYEAYGGGDTGYTDYDLVNTVLGTRIAMMVGTETPYSYWIASRYYNYTNASNYKWQNRVVSQSGGRASGNLYYYSSNKFSSYSLSAPLRPIVTLKSGLSYSGVGTEVKPMEIVE